MTLIVHAPNVHLGGGRTLLLSRDVTALEHIEPIYEWFDGWQQPTSEARTLEALPAQARRYMDRIRELVAAPIVYVSVGTRRDQIIGLE